MRALLRAKQSTDQLEDADTVDPRAGPRGRKPRPFHGGHVERVANYAVALGRAVGLDQTQCEACGGPASLHDIGKICVPDSILLKPGKLTSDEPPNHGAARRGGLRTAAPAAHFADVLPAVALSSRAARRFRLSARLAGSRGCR